MPKRASSCRYRAARRRARVGRAHVIEHLHRPQAIGELEAVKHAGTVVEQVDVVGEQVAVAADRFASAWNEATR